ncbi:hypothetical protein EDD86DRAFT_196673 [Gorgonomyces haynaldii]|nr:hypothetical protein EDD86DRAFT_196673 [Gorgonomyces haynaldii]
MTAMKSVAVFGLFLAANCATYEHCQRAFSQDKSRCSPYDGTKHGQCIDRAVNKFDRCIQSVDRSMRQYATYEPPSETYDSSSQSYESEYTQSEEYEQDYEQKQDYKQYDTQQSEYQQEKGDYQENNKGDYRCDKDLSYFERTRSPTLIQCVKIACAPGQTKHFVERALIQCHALEEQARATNGGKLPSGW